MNELPLEGFRHAIRQTHGARAQLRERVRVVEDFEGQRVWEGEVLVFQLHGHPTAVKCYAWELDGQVTAGPIDSPREAVRAAILSEESDG